MEVERLKAGCVGACAGRVQVVKSFWRLGIRVNIFLIMPSLLMCIPGGFMAVFPSAAPCGRWAWGAPGASSPVRATSAGRGPGLGWPCRDGLFLVAEIH